MMRGNAGATATGAPPAGRWILAATIIGSSMVFIDGTVVNVALPSLQRNLHATAADAQWVIEAYALFLSALILVGGSLGDILGRRRVYAVGIALFTLASLACGLAPGISLLVGARAVQGIGGALLVPGSLAIISAAFQGEQRGKAIGTWAGFTTITSAIGPLLGGWLTQHASWRWIFFINLPLAALTLALVFWRVPESRDEAATGGIDWLGALLGTAGLGAIVYGLIAADTRGLGDSMVLVSLGGGIVALLAFVAVEARGGAPMMPLTLFRSRTFSGTNLLTLLLYGALGGALYFLPFTLQQVQGYSPTEAGAAFLPFTLIVFALSRWSGGLVHRFGPRLPLVVGPIIAAVGFVLFALPGRGGSYWTTYFPAVVGLSVGMALVITPLTTAVMGAVAVEHAGIASGINNAVSRTAGLLAIAILGLVAVSTFETHLHSRLIALRLAPGVVRAVEAQGARLAATQPPPGIATTARARIADDVSAAFLDAFRLIMLLSAGLALLSALCAALLVEGKGAPARAP